MNENLNLTIIILSAVAFIARYNILINGLKERNKINSLKLYDESFADKVKNDFEKRYRERNDYLNSELAKLILFAIPIKLVNSKRKQLIANICLFILYACLVYGIANMILHED